MATRNGYLAAAPDSGGDLPVQTPGVIDAEVQPWELRIGLGALFIEGGFHVPVFPVQSYAVERAGYKVGSFFDDYYFRIHVLPRSIDVGNVLGVQTRVVSYWNAFPYDSVTIQSAAIEGDAGIFVTLPTGVTIPHESPPLEELTFEIVVTPAGPPSVDAAFVLDVEGVEYSVEIFGRRIVLFPFRPQWSSYVDETVTYPSWVIAAEDGTEQSGETSGGYPERSFEYTTVAKDEIEAQKLENLLFAWQGRFFGLPIWTERKRLTSAVAAGATSIPFDTFGFSIEPGSLVVLLSDDLNEIHEVDTVGPTGVTTVAPLESDWPEGSEVFPVAVAIVNPELQANRETVRVGRYPLSFDCEPTSTSPNAPALAAPLSYLGDELMLDPINWSSAMTVRFSNDRKLFKYSSAKMLAYDRKGYSRYGRKHNWQLVNEESIHEFRGLLDRRRGMARPMWMPSGMRDFTVKSTTGAVDSFINVEFNAYSNMVGEHPARRHIIIYFTDGSYVCVRITDSSLIGDTMQLQLAAPPGRIVSPDTVVRISYLNLYRFQSPAVTLRHLADRKVTVDAELVTRVRKEEA